MCSTPGSCHMHALTDFWVEQKPNHTLLHILQTYSFGDFFIAKPWTTEDRCLLADFVGVLSHSSALMSLPNLADCAILTSLVSSVTAVEWWWLPRLLVLRAFLDIVIDCLVGRGCDAASAARDVLTIPYVVEAIGIKLGGFLRSAVITRNQR